MRWLAAVAATLVLTGCGGSGDRRLIVSAATSLKRAFEDYGARFGGTRTRFSFAGSDELAAQIRQGVRPDVYAAANTALPSELAREGLLERPRTFALNRLVIALPPRSSVIHDLGDLGRPGLKLAVGAPSVPVGAYTRAVLRRAGRPIERRILANVRSNEPDVAGVVGKLSQGAADAGFVYATDVEASKGRLRAVELPRRLQPRVAYGVAVVTRARRHDLARRFVRGLLTGRGRSALRRAGFELPPR